MLALLVTARALEAFEKSHGAVSRGSIVILRTGWWKRWPDRKAYFGDENLTNLDALPPRGATLWALPMKIGGSGAPVRVVAVLP